MSNVLRVKRSLLHAVPTTLYWGELAWTEFEGKQTLYIGAADGSIVPIVNIGSLAPDILLPTAEAITAGTLINVYDNGTTMVARRADASLGIVGQVHGYVTEDYGASQTAKIYTRRGSIADIPGVVKGKRYYLSNSQPGKPTTIPVETSGHISQFIGNSFLNTKLHFLAEDPIIRA